MDLLKVVVLELKNELALSANTEGKTTMRNQKAITKPIMITHRLIFIAFELNDIHKRNACICGKALKRRVWTLLFHVVAWNRSDPSVHRFRAPPFRVLYTIKHEHAIALGKGQLLHKLACKAIQRDHPKHRRVNEQTNEKGIDVTVCFSVMNADWKRLTW